MWKWIKQVQGGVCLQTFVRKAMNCPDVYIQYIVRQMSWPAKRLLAVATFDNCVLLSYYAASSGDSLPTFRHYLSVPFARVKNPKRNELPIFLKIRPTRCTNFTNLFCHETLHVSDSSSVHHQEFIHCTLSNGICHTAFEQDQDGWNIHPCPARIVRNM